MLQGVDLWLDPSRLQQRGNLGVEGHAGGKGKLSVLDLTGKLQHLTSRGPEIIKMIIDVGGKGRAAVDADPEMEIACQLAFPEVPFELKAKPNRGCRILERRQEALAHSLDHRPARVADGLIQESKQLVGHVESAGVAQLWVKAVGLRWVELNGHQGDRGNSRKLTGRENLAGKKLSKECQRGGTCCGQGVVAHGNSLDPYQDFSIEFARQRQNLVPGPKRSRVVRRGLFCQVHFPEASRCAGLNPEVSRPRKLRLANPVRTFRQFKCQFNAFSRGDAHLGQHVRRVGRSTDAVRFQVHLANCRMYSKDQLDGAGKIERVVEVAGRTMPVIADCPERVLDLARDPADGAEQVPEQDK